MPTFSSDRGWKKKFSDAFRGIKTGVSGQSSFLVHFLITGAVVALGVELRMERNEWCILIMCITVVLSAELFNSALESLAKAVSDEWNAHLRDALNIASGAVVVAALGAATIGAILFVHRLAALWHD